MVTNSDLIDVITDPDLGGGLISFSRISETVDEKGRAQHSENFDTALANVQPVQGREREQLPEGDREKEAILIYTPAMLSAGGNELPAHRVYYRTGIYRVSLAEPWLEQGEFTKAIAVLEKYANE